MTAARLASPPRRTPRVTLSTASADHASEIHALVVRHLEEGHLLPRTLDDLRRHAERFVVATKRGRIIGCAELAPLSPALAEVRSLVVTERERGGGVGLLIMNELRRRAIREEYDRLCAFTHQPAFFVRLGFSIVPHVWLPEKIAADCHACPLFRRCGQFAMMIPLDAVRDDRGEAPALHA